MSALAPPALPISLPSWRREILAGLGTTPAMLPLMLIVGLIAYGATGARAAQAGLAAAGASIVIGGLVMVLVSRAQLPAASPNSPTALVLGALVARLVHDPAIDPAQAGGMALLFALTGATVMACGLFLALFGALRLGTLARFVPQTVLAGFMNGVAALIIWSQVGPLLGLPSGALQSQGWAALGQTQWLALVLGLGTVGVIVVVQERFPKAPAALVGLVLGVLAAELAQQALPAAAALPRLGLLTLNLPLPDTLAPLWSAPAGLLQRHGADLLVTALLLAFLCALESVLSMAAVDQLLNTRTEPNRELLALAAANLMAGLFGGLPLAYPRLRAMTTIAAGGRSHRAVLAGCLSLAAVFVLALPVLAHVPVAVLAGIMVMLGIALVDQWTRRLLQQWRAGERTADLHFSLLIVAVVCLITLRWGFVAGVGGGLLLAMVVFMRALNRSLLRARHTAADIPSRRVYPPALEAVLAPVRHCIVVFELEGALFFGNADRLTAEADSLPPGLAFLVLDFRRVSTIDASGAMALSQLSERLHKRGVALLLAGVLRDNRHGRALQNQGLFRSTERWQGHLDSDRAVEAAEQQLLADAGHGLDGLAVPLAQCALFAGLDAAQCKRLQTALVEHHMSAGQQLFREGDAGTSLFVLTQGSFSVVGAALADGGGRQRFVSFSPGMTFGETALLDGGGRTADAVADCDSTVYELPAAGLSALRAADPDLAAQLYRNLALHLSERLRSASGAWRRAAA